MHMLNGQDHKTKGFKLLRQTKNVKGTLPAIHNFIDAQEN